MKFGVIARADDRGLGIQTWEVCRNLNPDRVLLIHPDPRVGATWPQHPERYAEFDVTRARWPRRDDGLDEGQLRLWLSGLDVVYTAETLYDWRIPAWFDGAVVCHANPEMTRPDRWDTPGVTWWTATPWMHDGIPVAARVVPMPCPTDRFPKPNPPGVHTRFLHVVGHQAIYDRNGSQIVAQAWRHDIGDCSLKVTTQDDTPPNFRGPQGKADVQRCVPNYWDAYADVDVLLMPRRFGGLCLPVVEAVAAGLVPLMTDCSPNELWPGPRARIVERRRERVVGGMIGVHSPSPEELADHMRALCQPAVLASWQAVVQDWARDHSWDALRDEWYAELERAAR